LSSFFRLLDPSASYALELRYNPRLITFFPSTSS